MEGDSRTLEEQTAESSAVTERVTQRLNRRQVLRGLGLGAGVVTLGLGSTGTVAGKTVAVSGGGEALQEAIDAASAGDTLVVTESATYDPLTVNVPITIESDADPTIQGAGSYS